jgi:hypothetical protein
MKFLIQKINGKIVHDFSFTLLQSIDFKNWLNQNKKKEKILVKYFDTTPDGVDFNFKIIYKTYVPIGTVEFITSFIKHIYGLSIKPLNVPEELFDPCFTQRHIFNGNHLSLENCGGKYFIKSNDRIKCFSEIVECKDIGNQGTQYSTKIPVGNYQISDYISDIESEWRAFVYQDKLVGLQNYAGDFTKFPNVSTIKSMIYAYKSAPVAYTLDVAVCDFATVVIETHDFFSCGLYGFADHSIYPNMLYRWFNEYIKKNSKH